VAGSAVCNGFYILDNLVLDFQMALVAFDFILINMFRMHEVCILIFIESFQFPVAFVTVLPWDFTISENGVAVALVTRKSVIEDQGVVVTRGLGAHESFLRMTVVAVFDLGIMLAFFEMTDKTGALRYRDMFPLHDLRVAACALELFPSFEVLKMDFVIECDLIELHSTFQEPFFMAAFPETAIVPDLCPWLGFDIEFCPVTADHDQPFDLFSQLGLDATSWWVMTHAAFEVFMR
jgi:hypothetical protein